jgi:zinc-binding alcohol dehydrogenase/oxidoreductase
MDYRVMELLEIGKPLALGRRALQTPPAGHVQIRLEAAGLNRRDYWIWKGQYAKIQLPAVLGSDGCGQVEAIGAGVSENWLGKRVLVNPSMDWGNDPRAPGKSWRILGMPEDGTLAERLTVKVEQVFLAPNHLNAFESAALPLAALTGYRALFTQGGLKASDKILLTGIGGGVAQWMSAMAKAVGAEVWVTSGQDERLAKAQSAGAKGGANYKDPNWVASLNQQCPDGFDLIVDSAGGPGFADLIDTLKPGSRLVFFGATQGNIPELPIRKFYWRQLELRGTTMGSPQDFKDMLQLVSKHVLRPTLDRVLGVKDVDQGFAALDKGEPFGKVVVNLDF